MRARRGVALILVLWLVVVLGAIAASLTTLVHGRLRTVANLRDRAIGREAAESGIVATTREIEDSLETFGEGERRASYLNGLESRRAARDEALGSARFRVAIADVNARLDINSASEDGLTRFLSQFAGAGRARDAAREIRAYRRADAGPGVIATPILDLDLLRTRTSLGARSADAAAPFLTVDGDGNINRHSAPPQVRIAAAGQLVDAPTRLLLVSRGWRAGGALTHEIQAVYAIQGTQLALVRWRERDL